MKTIKICLIMYCFWLVDFLMTFIFVNFFGFGEANNIPGLFYQHWGGWIIFPIIVFVVVFLLSLLIKYVSERIRKESRFLSKVFLFFSIGIFSAMELITIINNISLIINYIF